MANWLKTAGDFDVNFRQMHPGQRRQWIAMRNGKRCCVCISLLMAGAAAFARPLQTAPVNPEFVEHLAAAEVKPAPAAPGAGQSCGWLPSPVNLAHLPGQAILPAPGVKTAFVPSYDLRMLGKVTSVKNQGSYGTCWAHATFGSMESCLLTGETNDFSENNLANLHGFDLGFSSGGNAFISMAYLARWGGPMAEFDDPYPNPGGSPAGLTVRKHAQQVRLIPPRTGPADNDQIKQALMDHGALYVSYYHNYAYYNSTYKSYLYTGSSVGNHAVAIVGWDDDFDKNKFVSVPAGNGAFIVKNSWGATWGDNGYFYVSYHDTKFAGSEIFAFLNAESNANYARIYQYDPLGWVGDIGVGATTLWGANIFTAAAGESLEAVGFFANSINTGYEIYIYTGIAAGSPGSGALAAVQTGTSSYPGYRTIALDAPAALAAGQPFSIVLKLTTPGYNYPQPIEYAYPGFSSSATASAGQSYYSSDGSAWYDLAASEATANFCIKGYAGMADTTQPTVTVNQAMDQADPASASPINFTVLFSEPVAGFAAEDVTLSGTAGAATAAVTGNGASYNVAVSGMTGSGTVIAAIPAGKAHDAAGNANAMSASTDNTVTYDATPPVFSAIAASPALAKQGETVTIAFAVSEALAWNPAVAVNGHAAGYVSRAGNNYTYSYTIQPSDADGDAAIAIAGMDLAGNPESAINHTALDVYTPVEITIHPQSQTNDPGSSASFTVAAAGTAPLFYQWQKNDFNIDAATGAQYRIDSMVADDAGHYRCLVANLAGTATSAAAVLTVNVVPAPSPPAIVSASDGKYTGMVHVFWNMESGATGYEIWRGTNDAADAATILGHTSATGFDDMEVSDDVTYYYWIKAVNAAGASAFSAPDSGYPGVAGPLVSVNGLVGDNVRISAGAAARIAVEMMSLPAEYIGCNVDWWAVACVHAGNSWYYLDGALAWVPFDGNLANCRPAYQGPLYNLPPVTVAQDMFLAPGLYNLWFAVDYPMDGILRLDGSILLSRVTMAVE